MKRKTGKKAYEIGGAGFDDAAAIYALIREHPREVLARSMSDILQNIDRFLVCREKGRVIGAVSWQILPELGKARDPSVEIKSLCVSRDRQGRGAGDALVRAAIKKAKTLHPDKLVVLTFSPEFFRRFGFKEVPKETLMHKLYMGCINCTKYESPFTCPEIAMTKDMSDA